MKKKAGGEEGTLHIQRVSFYTNYSHKRYTDTKPAVEKHSTPLYLTSLELSFLYPHKAISSITALKGLMRQRRVLLCKAFSSQVDFGGFLLFVRWQGGHVHFQIEQ